MKTVYRSLTDPLEGYPGYLLRRVSVEVMAKFARRVKSLGLRPTEASVLLVIRANHNATQSGIGQLLDIARANMAPLVSRLARMGYLERRAVDGRSHGLRLTAAGQSAARKLDRVVTAQEEELWARVPPNCRGHFMATLRAMRGA